MKKIPKLLKYSAFGAVGIIVLLIIWSFIEPRLLNTDTETVVIPNLPSAWEGKQIGQISDFQIGLWGDNRGTVRQSITRLVETKPAVVLISGDFVYHPGANLQPEITTVVEIVRPLVEAGIPTYAVLGNHDYGMSSKSAPPEFDQAERLERELEAAGVEVLENESVPIQLSEGDEPLYLVGVGSLWAERDRVQQALSNVPPNSPRIAMMHNPDSFKDFPPNTAPLAVAGHTHGGQVRVPGSPQWSWLRFTQPDEVHADGWIKDYGELGNQLYVNPGIGMSIAPIRLFCRPKLTLFTLKGS
jgi:predicted MPP superfamily phosphohydrolase